MPKRQPILSWEHIRDYTEKFQWKDSKGDIQVGYIPPTDAKDVEHVPYNIKFLTSKEGRVDEGRCITLKVFKKKMQRLVQFVASGETRRVCDYLVMEVDGTRFVVH